MAKSCGLILLCFALSVSSASATQFKVGGWQGWALPDPGAMSYNQWAQRNRFHVGDSLCKPWLPSISFQFYLLRAFINHLCVSCGSLCFSVFVYPKDNDSVLEVDKNTYDTCNTSTYMKKYDDGNTVFKFTRSGVFYFISGVESNCIRNESLVILVMGNHTNRHQLSPSSPPAEAPTPSFYPPPPSEALEPSPSSSPLPPSPPPSPSEITPAAEPAPAGEEPNNPPPPPNGAAVRAVSLVGLVGPAFFFLY